MNASNVLLEEVKCLKESEGMTSSQALTRLRILAPYEKLCAQLNARLRDAGRDRVLTAEETYHACIDISYLLDDDIQIYEYHDPGAPRKIWESVLEKFWLNEPRSLQERQCFLRKLLKDEGVHVSDITVHVNTVMHHPGDLDYVRVEYNTIPSATRLFEGFLSSYARAVLENTLGKQDIERRVAREYIETTTRADNPAENRVQATVSAIGSQIAYLTLHYGLHDDKRPTASLVYAILRGTATREDRACYALRREKYILHAIQENEDWLR